jgi:hypothetical protein
MGGVLRKKPSVALAFGGTLCIAACSSGRISVGDDRAPVVAIDSGQMPDVGTDDAIADSNNADVADGNPTAVGLAGITSACARPVSKGLLQSRPGRTPDVQVCGLSTAIFWRSSMAILCAGKSTTTCNSTTDPQFQNSTTAKDSTGASLDAAALPYVEVSARTMTFDYSVDGPLKMGSVVAVVYRDRVAYGIVGTVGVPDVIGDASYAMASALGINPDPMNGGVATNTVTYIAFTGPNAAVTVNEDHDEAQRIGEAAAAALIQAGK